MEGRKEFLLIQGSITVGDNLPSYQEAVWATNVCVVKPNSSFPEIVRAQISGVAPGEVICYGRALVSNTAAGWWK